uniref:Uncharacterized protein n=1 Tax=viral metagenome TaxID=1070528 RepID=A0A6C0JWG8_9ZZZZ
MANIDSTARLELNELRYISWKGKTLNQITSTLKKNNYILNQGDKVNIFKANPVKLYRKELASQTITSGNPRVSSSIQDFETPNGYSIVSSVLTPAGNCTSLANTVDPTIPKSKYETGGAIELSSNPKICFSQADNARRRCRSGGAAIKQYDITNHKNNYYTSSKQYLYDRNQTFEQNQFKYAVADNANCAAPTVKMSNNRFYSQGGVSSSDLTARVRYEEITNAAAQTANVYGAETANALAYGVNATIYTNKDRAGYSVTQTPVVDKYSGELKKCVTKKLSYAT